MFGVVPVIGVLPAIASGFLWTIFGAAAIAAVVGTVFLVWKLVKSIVNSVFDWKSASRSNKIDDLIIKKNEQKLRDGEKAIDAPDPSAADGKNADREEADAATKAAVSNASKASKMPAAGVSADLAKAEEGAASKAA